MAEFVHLHCHSSHSILDGLGGPKIWVDAAAERGFKALAITDHGACSGALELFNAAREKGIKPIVGTEFYVVDDLSYRPGKKDPKQPRYHLTVLAKSFEGLQSIFKQLTLANKQFYRKPILSMEQIFDFKDCIVMTACAFGILQHPKYDTIIPKMLEVYGDDLYLEIMPHWLDAQQTVNARAETMSALLGIAPVATNDCHYPKVEDTSTHDVLLAVQTNANLTDPTRFSFLNDGLDGLYLKTGNEMIHSFKPWVEGKIISLPFLAQSFKSTIRIAEKCSGFSIPKLDFALPVIKGCEDEGRALMKLCMEGWAEKIKGKVGDEKTYLDRLRHELTVISGIKAIRYFLIGWDFLSYAQKKGVLCGFGRGSVGGSLVAYLLAMTNLDPVEYELYFERFLRPDRIDLPDIDFDFAGKDREVVIQYIKDTYGAENVCQISTSSKMHGKSAFRDVARVHGMPISEVNEVSKRIDKDLPLSEVFSSEGSLSEFSKANQRIIKHAIRLEGQLRSKGMHAGGVVISEDGFSGRGVLERRKEGAVAIHVPMDECERFGLLKFDILGLSNLSILKDTADLVGEHHGVKIDYHAITPDDPNVLKQFSDGNTAGFFQFESDGITALCKRLNPIRNFETLIHINALYRPGPLDSGMVESYVRRYCKLEAVSYHHANEVGITEQTLGLPIFQEQIMAYFVKLAGFTWPEADNMRAIIAKSKGAEKLEESRPVFVEGSQRVSGISIEVANEIYNDISKFGRYGFNRCIAGSTVLRRAGNNQYAKLTVEEMHKIRNDRNYAKRTGHFDLYHKWDGQGHYGYGLSMTKSGRVKKNIIHDIQPAGLRTVFQLKLVNGAFINVTENHKFPTLGGEKTLGELSFADSIYFCEGYEKTDFREISRFSPISYFLSGEKNPGYTNGSFTKYQKFREETPDICELCGSTDNIETHHKDGDRSNSEWENLQKLCSSCHKKEQYKLGRARRGEKGYPTSLIPIESITKIGEMETWDVTMNDPDHNFVTDQNIVTCNSHAASYSLIAYLTAWAKYHYPREFMCALLRSTVDETPQTIKYVKEAKRLNIQIKMPDVNESYGAFEVSTGASGSIVAGFNAVKGIGAAVATNIIKARDGKPFFSFQDFFDRTSRRIVNKGAVEKLAKAGVFDSFHISTKWIIDHYAELADGETPSPAGHRPDFDEREKLGMRSEMLPGLFCADDASIRARMEIHKDILDMLAGQMAACTDCRLSMPGVSPVPFQYHRDSRVLVVGDWPGQRELKSGEQMADDASKKALDLFKEVLGLTPGKLLKTTVFGCKSGAATMPKEVIEQCECGKKWLDALLKATNPEVIFAMGNPALGFFTGKFTGIMKMAGESLWIPKYKAMAVFSILPKMLYHDEDGSRKELFIKALKKLEPYLLD